MGQPSWSKIPFEKMPEWKRQEILSKAKKTVQTIETLKDEFVCTICNRSFTSEVGMKVHKSKHK